MGRIRENLLLDELEIGREEIMMAACALIGWRSPRLVVSAAYVKPPVDKCQNHIPVSSCGALTE